MFVTYTVVQKSVWCLSISAYGEEFYVVLRIYDARSLVSITLNYKTFREKIWRAVSLVKCTFIILRMTLLFQQRSVIRYYCLRGKTNAQIVIKLEQNDRHNALGLRAVEKWAARFRAGRETVEDDERPGRPLRTILVMQFSDFLRSNLILPPAR
jgi:hypothetical protein